MKPIIAFLLVFLFPYWILAEVCPPVEITLDKGEHQQWWMIILDFLVQISAPLIVTVLSVLGTWVVRRLCKKLDMEQQESLLRLKDSIVTAGVAYAEEQARNGLNAGRPPEKGSEKIKDALYFVKEEFERTGVGKMTEHELRKLIESRLQMERSKPDGVIPSEHSLIVNGKSE